MLSGITISSPRIFEVSSINKLLIYIESVGKIEITINTMTEICCNSDFDTKLSQLFLEMRDYKVVNNTLILEGGNKTVQLRKE